MWLFIFCSAFLLDLILGDPQGLPHPVRLLGKLIKKIEAIIRTLFPKANKGELVGGGIFCALVIIITVIFIFGILFISKNIAILYIIIQILLCYYILAMKSLKVESCKVYNALLNNDLQKSREAVSWIVGRDTGFLSEEGVAKAAIETVAENCSDGFVAPAFYIILGGPILGYIYKAVNTMDSMVGYKNEKYLYFGRAAARLDDLLNFIPSRLAAYSMIAAAYILGYDGKNALRIYKRDRHNHKSPNSAQTEAVCAGALGLQLAGDAWYFGQKHEKPFIGDAKRFAVPMDIDRKSVV